MGKFTYDDVVRIVETADESLRPGSVGWVVGVFEERPVGSYFSQFPPGVVYTVEYEDGEAKEVHEDFLEAGRLP
ncbi:hypothetical protein [Lysobacter antibioticus]|uniref:hypothetical protein n=1 Tax=Lysobacter antibioticus TaxID=84531 RepID=UPI000AC755C8|nr:hypothetical protein [Lysobacter antibioticus]